MRTQNKGTRSSRFRITTIAIAVASSFAMTPAWAADSDIVDKGAQPIAYDISPANDGTNIAIGKNAKVFILSSLLNVSSTGTPFFSNPLIF